MCVCVCVFFLLLIFIQGYRIGKGEGFADMEYAMMVAMGAVNESTVIATVVHDCQVSSRLRPDVLCLCLINIWVK